MPNILVAYASKTGSTTEVAQTIGDIFREDDVTVDVRPVKEIKDISPYQAVVLGTAIRMGKPMPEAVKFIQKHRDTLNQMPVACFSMGITLRDNTPENREKAMSYLTPLLSQIDQPVGVEVFAGKVDYRKLSWFWRTMASYDNSGEMREGDWRDWDAIRAWALEIRPLLLKV
jgi:menaquinone-dependent protoporphyrinogen oxidase